MNQNTPDPPQSSTRIPDWATTDHDTYALAVGRARLAETEPPWHPPMVEQTAAGAAHLARPLSAREVMLERALLALRDPAGEADAVAILSTAEARAIVRRLAAAPTRRVMVPSRNHYRLDPSELLAAIGAQPGRAAGYVNCPAHEDDHPSLHWSLTPSGQVLLYDFGAQCSFDAILEAVGLVA